MSPGGHRAGDEVDWVSGGDIVHVDVNVFSAMDWKLCWLLLVPAVNYAKDWIRYENAGAMEFLHTNVTASGLKTCTDWFVQTLCII